MKMRHVIVAFVICTATFQIQAQKVSNVQWEQKNNTINITYNINGISDDLTCMAQLFVSLDGGKTFQGPLQKTSGDIGSILTNGAKAINWFIFEEIEATDKEVQMVFEVRLNTKKKPLPKLHYLSYTYSPSAPFGLTYGSIRRWGWYARIKTNFNFSTGEYTYTGEEFINTSSIALTNEEIQSYKANGTIDQYGYFTYLSNYNKDGYYTFTGKSEQSRYAITLGAMGRVFKSAYLYAGGGYGVRNLLWEINEYDYATNELIGTSWAVVEESSGSGFEVEFGGIVKFKKIALSFGVAHVGQYTEYTAGLGILF